ncbi:Uncharacterised protein [Enterobacter cloacae]|nr:Uncharacterised protein [Enterobacter cloacae]
MLVDDGHYHHRFTRGGAHTLINTTHTVAELQIHAFDIKQTRFRDGFNIQNGGLL